VKTATPSARIVSLRGMLIAAVAFAGAVHLLLAVSRVVGWRVEGVGFGATGVAQLFVAIALLVSDRRDWLWGVLVVTLLPFAAWLYTRTIGYPAGTGGPLLIVAAGIPGLVAIEAIDTYLVEPSGNVDTHATPLTGSVSSPPLANAGQP